MPRPLKVLLGLLAIGAAFDLVMAVQAGATSSWVRFALTIGCIVGLLRGSEGVRVVLRGLAGVAMVAGGFLTLQAVGLAVKLPMSGLVLTAVVAAVATFGLAIFMFVALGLPDVQTWTLRRSIGAH